MKSARHLGRTLLLVQLGAALLIAWGAMARLGMAPWQAVLLGIVSVVLVRLLINANNFVMAACFAGATPQAYRLGAGARLRMLAGEFKASMLVTSWFIPRASAATRIHPDSRHPPVLLLHGYGCNSGYWVHLTPLLDAARISHATVDLEPVAGDIDGYVPLVEHAVRELLAASGAGQVAIVAHSMGGLVARAWMRDHGSAQVARVITLGTPHHGTALARFGLGRNAVQMRRDSEWLRALARSEDAATRALLTSIYTHHDNIVSPRDSCRLEGARNLEFGGIGHVALGSNPRVLAAVMEELAASSPASAPAPSLPTLLVVDDDAFMREVLVDALEGEPWRVLGAASAEEALALLAREPVEVILSDQCMPGMQGTEMMARVSRAYPHTVRLILSGLSAPSELEAIERACAAGQVDRHLSKPWAAATLRETLRAAFALQRERH
jgi:CheY-like chemotaxis protein/triacylglycerol esterase/lipase EstA (alpha/beta hydrolase family)